MKKIARLRTFTIGERVRINDKAPADYADREGIISEIGPGESEYRVEIEDGVMPTTGYLNSTCLDPLPGAAHT